MVKQLSNSVMKLQLFVNRNITTWITKTNNGCQFATVINTRLDKIETNINLIKSLPIIQKESNDTE